MWTLELEKTLVSEIQKHPCLWSRSLHNTKPYVERKNIYDEIIAKLKRKFPGQEEAYDSIDKLQRKFRNMKNYCNMLKFKLKSCGRSEQDRSLVTSWPHFGAINEIIISCDSDDLTNISPKPQQSTEKSEDVSSIAVEYIYNDDNDPQDDSEDCYVNEIRESPRPAKRRRISSNNYSPEEEDCNRMSDIVTKSTHQPRSQSQNAAFCHFIESELNQLSPEKVKIFKLKIITALQELLTN